MNIYDFIREPYKSVIKGYEPSVMDCWSVMASLTGNVFMGYWERIDMGRDLLDMTLREIIKWFFSLVVFTLTTATFPLLFWVYGTALYFNLKDAKERHRKQSERLAKLI